MKSMQCNHNNFYPKKISVLFDPAWMLASYNLHYIDTYIYVQEKQTHN